MAPAKSFYGRLLKVGSHDRLRLEDFLTEALAELINAVPQERRLSFCERLFCTSEVEGCYQPRAGSGAPVRALTQVSDRTHGIRLDLVIEVGSAVAMVVECKVAAGYTGRRLVDGTPRATGQLKAYDIWARSKNPAASLILLTHATEIPDGFLEQDKGYRAVHRAVARWFGIHRTLRSGLDEFCGHAQGRPHVIASELCSLLEEYNMVAASPTSRDLDVLRSYAIDGTKFRLFSAVDTVRPVIKGHLASKYKIGLTCFGEGPREAWIRTAADWSEKVTIEWGLWLWDAESDNWPTRVGLLPGETAAFYAWVSTVKDLPDLTRWPGWRIITDNDEVSAYFTVPAGKVLASDHPGPAVMEWLSSAVRQAAEIADSVYARVR